MRYLIILIGVVMFNVEGIYAATLYVQNGGKNVLKFLVNDKDARRVDPGFSADLSEYLNTFLEAFLQKNNLNPSGIKIALESTQIYIDTHVGPGPGNWMRIEQYYSGKSGHDTLYIIKRENLGKIDNITLTIDNKSKHPKIDIKKQIERALH